MGEGRTKTSVSTARTGMQKCSWGVSTSVQLNSQKPQRPQPQQVPIRSTINLAHTLKPFEQTLRPFEQTVNPFEETIRPFAQTIKPSSKQTQPRHSQQLPTRPSQHHAGHPPRRNNQVPQPQSQQAGFRHSVATLRPPRTARPTERPSQQFSNHHVSSFQRSLGPSSHRQPLAGTPMTLSDLVTEEPTDSSNDDNTPLTVDLSPRRRREVISRMKKSVKETILDSMPPDSSTNPQWKLKLRKKDISCYVDETTVQPGQTRFCCVSHTHATVDEVMSLFLSPDKETQQRNDRLLYDNLLETRVLTELREPTKERPMNSMSVRYSTYQTPGPLANRQICSVVATDMVRQPDGSTIGYCLWDSIDDPEFAKAGKRPGLEVCKMFRSGFFVRRSGRRGSSDKPGQTKIVYMVGMENAAWASGLTTRYLMEKYGNTLGRICSHLRRKNFDSQTFVTKTQWASKISAKSCKQCEKPFQVLSCRVNCHACGQVVCRSCTSKESVEIQGVGVVVPTHICFWCLEKAGLPAPASASAPKTRKDRRIKRLESDTAVMYRASCQANALTQQREHSMSVVNADFSDDDDEDRESGEWAITTQGIPVQESDNGRSCINVRMGVHGSYL
ncbi:hypothetical protein PHYSODRAFT_324172 [Phytophthora sojae]|uniref:FYVE-type domain-containing protein n=1 Tax=Phytophthora sojae (strain P6497) TaxID=1094619 RepID=G4YRE2_PHYSP|nr:hypothetical protein PHYSODRAFT_324172 [Phytophthora sojae]EGZ22876.1 hypothetical protein PHYSODRAFT_324172 [Phytophthora sojae]|eukprot:XP_009518164.1 hypothetical protein PHYSODRAFT_324172 [Phytophthora sojae]